MKNLFKKSWTKVDDLMDDDHIKIAGLIYRVTSITAHDTAYTIQLDSIVNPKYTAILTFKKNTLMKIMNQK